MPKVRFYLRDPTTNIALKSYEIESDFLELLEQNKQLRVEVSQSGYKSQYIGNMFNKGTEKTTTLPPVCPPDQHWDAIQNKCVPNIGPLPTGQIYDMNTNIDWAALNGKILTVSDTYGPKTVNSKGFHMNASGSPRAILNPADKSWKLEHDGKYGRGYFRVINYNSLLQGKFMLDNTSHNLSLKTRNRHQYEEENSLEGVPDKLKQGGIGAAIKYDRIEFQVEVVHGTNILDATYDLSKKLEANKEYQFKYTVKDVSSDTVQQILALDYGSGFEPVAERKIKPPVQFFDRKSFEQWSEFWVRLNATDGGWVKIQNLQMFSL